MVFIGMTDHVLRGPISLPMHMAVVHVRRRKSHEYC